MRCEPGAAAARIIDPERLRRRDVLMLPRALRSAIGADRGAASARRGGKARRIERGRHRGRGGEGRRRARDRARRPGRRERGVLVAPLIAHRDLQPAVAHTPFRHSVPAAQPLFVTKPRMRRAATGAVVLLYHRVDEVTGLGDTGELRGTDRDAGQPLHPRAPGGDRLRRRGAGRVRRHLRRRLRRDHAPRDARAHESRRARDDLHLDRPRGVAAQLLVGRGAPTARRARDRPVRLTIDGDTRAWARAGAAEKPRRLLAAAQGAGADRRGAGRAARLGAATSRRCPRTSAR